MIRIDREKCMACGACVRDCVVHVLTGGADGFPTVSGHSYRVRVSKNLDDWSVIPSAASESETPVDTRHYGTGETLTLYAEVPDPFGFYQVIAA